MSRQTLGLALSTAAVVVAIFGIAFTANVTTNEASTEIYGIDVTGLTSAHADELSAQRRAAR
jgi:hypothetical protein